MQDEDLIPIVLTNTTKEKEFRLLSEPVINERLKSLDGTLWRDVTNNRFHLATKEDRHDGRTTRRETIVLTFTLNFERACRRGRDLQEEARSTSSDLDSDRVKITHSVSFSDGRRAKRSNCC